MKKLSKCHQKVKLSNSYHKKLSKSCHFFFLSCQKVGKSSETGRRRRRRKRRRRRFVAPRPGTTLSHLVKIYRANSTIEININSPAASMYLTGPICAHYHLPYNSSRLSLSLSLFHSISLSLSLSLSSSLSRPLSLSLYL
jgi:hypothetical protein